MQRLILDDLAVATGRRSSTSASTAAARRRRWCRCRAGRRRARLAVERAPGAPGDDRPPGDGRRADPDVTRLMRLVPGLMAKDGAEGVHVAALPDGRAVALKIADGGGRARRR